MELSASMYKAVQAAILLVDRHFETGIGTWYGLKHPSSIPGPIYTCVSRVELSTAFRDISRCYARENISARRFARGVHIARSFVELRRDA